jgi:hypothetical protein
MTGPNVPDLTAAAGRLDAREFRAALGCFATGVMVIAKRVSLAAPTAAIIRTALALAPAI